MPQLTKTWVRLHIPRDNIDGEVVHHVGSGKDVTDGQVANWVALARLGAARGSHIEVFTATYDYMQEGNTDVAEASAWYDI